MSEMTRLLAALVFALPPTPYVVLIQPLSDAPATVCYASGYTIDGTRLYVWVDAACQSDRVFKNGFEN